MRLYKIQRCLRSKTGNVQDNVEHQHDSLADIGKYGTAIYLQHFPPFKPFALASSSTVPFPWLVKAGAYAVDLFNFCEEAGTSIAGEASKKSDGFRETICTSQGICEG